MEFHMELQAGSIWISLLTGFGLAVLYDCFRILRTMVSGNTNHSGIQDFFFMLFSALITYLLSIAVDYGIIRFYVIACEVIGACIYFMTIGVVTHKVAAWMHRVFLWCRKQVIRFFVRPVRFCLRKFWHLSRSIVQWVKRFLKKIAKKRKNPLKKQSRLVYNQDVSLDKKSVVQKAGKSRGELKHEGYRREKKEKQG